MPLIYSEAGGARDGGVATEEAPEKRSLSAGRTHATCTGAASTAAKGPMEGVDVGYVAADRAGVHGAWIVDVPPGSTGRK